VTPYNLAGVYLCIGAACRVRQIRGSAFFGNFSKFLPDNTASWDYIMFHSDRCENLRTNLCNAVLQIFCFNGQQFKSFVFKYSYDARISIRGFAFDFFQFSAATTSKHGRFMKLKNLSSLLPQNTSATRLCVHIVTNVTLHTSAKFSSRAHPASYPMGTGGPSPGGKAAGAWSQPIAFN
jgi:hypothetical protein